MVLLTLTIGVLNLCLGYALAVRLGYGPPTLSSALSALMGTATVNERADTLGQVGEFPADELLEDPDSLPDEGDDVPEEELSEVEKWDREMKEDDQHMAKLEKDLRRSKAQNNGPAISKCVIELRQLCESLLQRQGEVVEDVGGRLGGLDSSEIRGDLEDALLSQLSQLETTIGNLRQADTTTDPVDAASKMLVEIKRLRAVSSAPREIITQVA